MVRPRFGNMNNLYSIGHGGNFSDESSSGSAGMNLYGSMFSGSNDIIQSFQNIVSKSNTTRILIPALDQIFETIQSSPFAGLEALGISGYLDPAKAVTGFSLPKPLGIPKSKKDQSRGV